LGDVGDLQGKACLPDPTRTDDRDESFDLQ